MPQMQCLSGVLATFQRPGRHKAKRRVQSEIAAVVKEGIAFYLREHISLNTPIERQKGIRKESVKSKEKT